MKKIKLFNAIKYYANKIYIKNAETYKRILVDNRYYESIKEDITCFPVSNGSRFYSRLDINVGIIADEFIYESYKPTCNLIYISDDNWETVLKQVECIVITSAWRGLKNEWVRLYDDKSRAGKNLTEIIRAARKKGIRILFYSKEDPPNFKWFIDIAKKCDYIFTSAEECIPEYIKETGNTNCFVLPFAFNPILYNPIEMGNRIKKETVLFAGSWMKKYPERIKNQRFLFDIIIKNKLLLKIIDRNYHIKNTRYIYPIKYIRCVVPSFRYKELPALYKLHEYVLNFNSVTDSSSMYAARVCDASACGSIIISNYSSGMAENYPNVKIVESESELRNLIKIKNKYSLRCDSVRTAFRNGTTFERLNFMLASCGINIETNGIRRIAVIVMDNCSDIDAIKEMFNSQTYEYKDLFVKKSDVVLGDYDFVTFWNDKYDYSNHYIEDMINCFKFTDSDFVTCGSIDNSHQYVNSYKDVCETVFSLKASYDKLSDVFNDNNLSGYSIFRNNVVTEEFDENVV